MIALSGSLGKKVMENSMAFFLSNKVKHNGKASIFLLEVK
jgi:hypothetical protein